MEEEGTGQLEANQIIVQGEPYCPQRAGSSRRPDFADVIVKEKNEKEGA